MYIDSHAHVDFESFDDDRAAVLQRALDAGVQNMIQIALGPEEDKYARAYQIVKEHPALYMAAGLHPHDADAYTPDVHNIVATYLQKDKVIALGEIGLDYYYDHSDREKQKICFASLIELAIQDKKPICVHTRDAFEDTHQIAKDAGIFSKTGGVIHCFTGTPDQAKAFVDLGAYISFSGVVTFKKAQNVRDAVKVVPLDRILIETDCPFLAPVPYRGKRNEPAHVVEVAKAIANIHGKAIQDIGNITTDNCKRLFGI